jgi:hypothetical protein
MAEAVERANAQLAEWVREAHEEQVIADVLREHADEHQRAAYYAQDKAQRLRELLDAQGDTDDS